MSYANGTTHYNLPQTLGTDKRDWFDTNQAFADIDAAIYGAVQNASQAVTDLSALTTRVGAAENDIDTLETSIGTHTSQISALQTSVTQMGNAITDNKQDILDMIESTQEASATATYAHAVGSYFIYNDTLYVTTVAIAVGDTIVPNTNCETTDIGTVLAALNSDLSSLEPIVLASATGDGVKTRRDILNSMFADLQNLTEIELLRCSLETGDNVFHIRSYQAGTIISFAGAYADNTNLSATSVVISAVQSSTRYIQSSVNSSGTFSANDVSEEVVPSGTVYRIVG